MKMKKYLSFLLIFVLLAAAFMPKAVEAASSLGLSENLKSGGASIDQNDINEAIRICEEKMEEQAPALEAYSVLRSMFGVTDQGEDIYPFDYAGAWYENGTLFIALTSFEQIQKYEDKLAKFDCINYVLKELSLNQLGEIRDGMYELVKNDISISCFYIDVTKNKIIYETSEPQESASEKFYNIMSSSTVQLYKSADVAKKIDGSLFEIIKGGEITNQSDVYGGDKMCLGSVNGPSFSVGISGTIHDGDNHYEGLLTCGHGMTVSGTNATIYLNGSVYGKTFYTMHYENSYGDWSAVRKTSDNFTQVNKVHASQAGDYYSITGTTSELAKGFSFMKYGYRGGYCTGTVEETNVTVTFDGVTVTGLERASLDSGESLSGDSGGPYYTGGSVFNGYYFVGVHKGIDIGDDGSQKLIFTPCKCFSLWFSPKCWSEE